jgi:DNA-binding PadR family transcriptional regulator
MALAHAILASLLDASCSGYDLAKQFDSAVGCFWEASHQQIYRELARLETDGHVVAEKVEQATRPNKKLYHITSSGRDWLKTWIAQPASLSPLKDDLLVKLYAGHLVPRPILLAELHQHRQQHAERLNQYRARLEAHLQDDDSATQSFAYLAISHSIRAETAWLAWCDDAIALLEKSEKSRGQPNAPDNPSSP